MLLSDQGGEIGMIEEKVGGLMDLIRGDLDVTGRLSSYSLNFKHCPLLSNVGHFAQ